MHRRSLRIAEIALRVDDLKAMFAFYRDVMGFLPHKSLPGIEFLEVGPLETPLGAGGHPILLALFKRDDVIPATGSFDHMAFEIPPETFDEELALFESRDMVIHRRDWPDTLPWPGRAFFFRDPEGNVVEFICGASDLPA
jgi:catechol 2,3-dioxygenase-like lactoylglutathione lyase family enzyme